MIPAVPGFADQSAAVLLYLAVVSFVAGLARGFSGFGSAMIFVPLASVAIGPVLAVPILMILDGLGALPMLPASWRNSDRVAVFIMSVGALLAIPLGTWILTRFDPVVLRWAISISILLLIGGLAHGWRYRGQPHAVLTVAVGMVSGVLTGAAQIGGPPAIGYWLSSAATAARVRANMVLFLALSEVYALPVYGAAGLFNFTVAALALAAVPAFLIGVGIGTRMFGLASQETFRWTCFGLIALAAIGSLPAFS